jgi:hypothetical protein
VDACHVVLIAASSTADNVDDGAWVSVALLDQAVVVDGVRALEQQQDPK